MSRLSRTDAAKSTIATWRWLATHSDAPRIDGNVPDLFQVLPSGTGGVTTQPQLEERLKLMEHLGLTSRETRHEYLTEGNKTYPKLRTTTTIKADVEDGAQMIGKHFASGGFLKVAAKGNLSLASRDGGDIAPDPEKVAIRTNEAEQPVEAVVGEDAPSPFEALRGLRKGSDAEAFVEAARQYERRNDFVIAKLTEIEALGITIDREKVLKGVHLQRDDELEGVARVLPYIDELESRVKQAEGWRADMLSAQREMRTLRDEKNKAEAELRRQKDANERLATKMARDVVTRPQVLVGE